MKFNNKSYASNIKGTHQIGGVPQSLFQNQNPVQDQDHNFTLDFNTRITFYT